MLALTFKILFLIALIRVLIITDKPFVCSGLYAFFVFLFGIFTGFPFIGVLIAVAISYGVASLYFWLLDRQQGIMWWPVMILGMFIIVVVF